VGVDNEEVVLGWMEVFGYVALFPRKKDGRREWSGLFEVDILDVAGRRRCVREIER